MPPSPFRQIGRRGNKSVTPSGMLKKTPNFVLGSSKSSTYRTGTFPVLSRLRPCWMIFLSIPTTFD
jgi:hypothetical protein